jgi:hypothetical protein
LNENFLCHQKTEENNTLKKAIEARRGQNECETT